MPTTRPFVLTGLLAASLVAFTPACGSDTSGAGTGAGGGSPTGGSSGSSGSGGASGSGGSAAGTGGGSTGGSSDTGGSGGTGGTGGATGGTGGSMSGSGGSANPSDDFTLSVSLSSAIATVGILTFTLDGTIDSADVEFGRDQSAFEFKAPVDLTATDHRTLLLGMKQDTTYYVRVTAKVQGKTLVSAVANVKSGFLRNGLPAQTITDHDATALYAGGGFTTACTGFGGFGNSTTGDKWAFIFDKDGDVVWAYDLAQTSASACTRARMSYDGKYMWAGNFGNTTSDGALSRFTLDGLESPVNYSLPGRSHDFAILPNDHVIYFARTDGGAGQTPEAIYELDPATSMSTLVYDQMTDFAEEISEKGGHTNHITYVPELNAVSFSMYFADTVALISYPEGKLLAAFGGPKSTFSNMAWTGQHGHDVHADHVNIFNNEGTNGGASVLRFKYDLAAKTATEDPDYSSGIDSPAFGDVKEQPNGNFFLTYSTSSVMQELDASLNLLREVQTTVLIGYTEHRASLYGKPPPYDR